MWIKPTTAGRGAFMAAGLLVIGFRVRPARITLSASRTRRSRDFGGLGLESGFRVWDQGSRGRSSFQGSELRVQGSECRVQGLRFGAEGAGFRVQSVGLRVQRSPLRNQAERQDMGSRFWSLGVGIQGVGLRIQGQTDARFRV